MSKLTDKQEKFCHLVIELGNNSEAYRQAYNAGKMKTETINRKAKELMDNGKITARLTELREPIIEKHNITVESLLKELEEARTCALTAETVQSSAAVSATMSKAKLLGMDKQIIDHTISIADSGGNEW
jgi:phage terminase small subunit